MNAPAAPAPSQGGAPREGAARRDGRRAAVEVVRIVACVGIVWFHLRLPGDEVALGGLHAFAALTTAFAARAAVGKDLPGYAKDRLRLIGVPWLFWTLVFATLYAVDQRGAPLAWLDDPGILYGPGPHLWYLPFALAASMVAFLVGRSGRLRSWKTWAVMTWIAAALAALAHERPLGNPADQWVSIAPAASFGVMLAFLPAARATSWLLGVVVFAAATFAALTHVVAAVPGLVGMTLAGLALLGRAQASPKVLACSGLTLGIYLAHPLVYRLTYPWLIDSPALHFVVVLTGSVALVALGRRTALARVL